MSITKNLVVGIRENALGGDPDAVLLKTNTDNKTIIIEMSCPKVSIKIEDLQEGIDAISSFIWKRIDETPVEEVKTPSLEESLIAPIPTFEFGEEDNV